MICQMIGIFLYCGQAVHPLAMFPQSNNLPTEYMAQQMVNAGKSKYAAQPTPFDRCEPGMRMMNAECTARLGFSPMCFTGCAR